MSFTLPEPRSGERNYYLMPPPPPYRFWLVGDRLKELQAYIDNGGTLEGADFLEYKRLRGKQDLFYFAKYIAGFTWLEWPLHGPLAWAWQAPDGYRAPNGQVYGKFRMAVIPRGHLKTSLLTQAYAMWRLVRNPEERILIYTMHYDFASTIMNYIRTTFEGGGRHGELFLQCYGDLIPAPSDRSKWTTNDITINRQGAFSDPSIKARGIGSRVTGGHHTLQLIDDLVGEELSRTQMDKVIRDFDNLDPLYHSLALGERRYVGTPWAFFDPIVYVTQNWSDAMVARLPWRDAVGEPLFKYEQADREVGLPIGTSRKEFEEKALNIKRRASWFFSCQYECWPKDEDKVGFRREWFKRFRMRRNMFFELDADGSESTKGVRVADCNTFILVDPAVQDPPGSRTSASADGNVGASARQGDFAAWIVLCVTPENYWFIPRVLRMRCNTDTFLDKTHELVSVWQPKFVAIEQVAAQRLFYHLFVRDWRAGKPKFQLIPWQGGHASKNMRIRGLVPMYSNGFVFHRESGEPEVQQGMQDLENELVDFPSAEHDDASDALSAALPLVYAPGKQQGQAVDDALRSLSLDTKLKLLDPHSRAELLAWERKKRKGVVTGDKVLLGGTLDDDVEDELTGLVDPYELETLH